MFNALIIDHEVAGIKPLVHKLNTYYPQINICGECGCLDSAYQLLSCTHPDLVFIDTVVASPNRSDFISNFLFGNHEIIVTSPVIDYAVSAVQKQVCGYLLKPIEDEALSLALDVAIRRRERQKSKEQDQMLIHKLVNTKSTHEVIGIPTIEGLEFVIINDIIRCEGLQKCTRIITKSNCDTISSYNIGEFRKQLEPYGFFSPHKSHLINLRYIRRYKKEGSVTMLDNSQVPVARRRRNDFLNNLKHI